MAFLLKHTAQALALRQAVVDKLRKNREWVVPVCRGFRLKLVYWMQLHVQGMCARSPPDIQLRLGAAAGSSGGAAQEHRVRCPCCIIHLTVVSTTVK